jgi:hemerythrin-like domain-containing protein
MLLACHGRIRRQLATLVRLQRHLPENGADAEARAAATAILRYFDRAGADHHADEERSLLPRLTARAPDIAALASVIVREHRELDQRWRKLRPLLSSIAAGRYQALPVRMVRGVCEAYATHIEREEASIIPRARELLDAATLAEVGREFAARRGHADGGAALRSGPVRQSVT